MCFQRQQKGDKKWTSFPSKMLKFTIYSLFNKTGKEHQTGETEKYKIQEKRGKR